MKLMSIFAFLILLTSCSGGPLPKIYRLETLRVLALAASQPEVAPGATVTITPLISDVYGNGRALTFEAYGCPDPGIAFGAEPTCEGSLYKTNLGSGSVTGLSAPNYTSAVNSFNVTIPNIVIAGRSSVDVFNGVSYLVTYTVRANDGTAIRAFRRILASTKSTKNSNPDITDILSNGVSLTTLPSTNTALRPVYTGGSQESYFESTSEGIQLSKTESLLVSWYTTDGKFDVSRTTFDVSTFYLPPSSSPGGRNVLVIGVVRDNRGGLDYLIKTL